MGEFVAISGVSKASRRDVLKALEDFAVAGGGTLSPAPGGQPFKHLVLAGEDFGPVMVMYPNGFYRWDEASKHLSEALGAPVISLHIHDGNLWTYILYRDGDEIDRFNPIPATSRETSHPRSDPHGRATPPSWLKTGMASTPRRSKGIW